MSSRKKKKRQKKKGRPSLLRRPPLGPFEGATVVVSPPGHAKMSEVLIDFLEPYSELMRNEEAFKKMVAIAAIAWNTALFPVGGREEAVQELVRAMPPEVRPDMRRIVDELIQRKLTHFASNKRAIISCE